MRARAWHESGRRATRRRDPRRSLRCLAGRTCLSCGASLRMLLSCEREAIWDICPRTPQSRLTCLLNKTSFSLEQQGRRSYSMHTVFSYRPRALRRSARLASLTDGTRDHCSRSRERPPQTTPRNIHVPRQISCSFPTPCRSVGVDLAALARARTSGSPRPDGSASADSRAHRGARSRTDAQRGAQSR
jgi:hypothetical protein